MGEFTHPCFGAWTPHNCPTLVIFWQKVGWGRAGRGLGVLG